MSIRYYMSGVCTVHIFVSQHHRLTPRLALIMMLEGCLMLSASDGPVWKRLVSNRRQSCVDYWWTNLLYISNYINPYKTVGFTKNFK